MKKYLLGLFAVALAIGGSAFTTFHKTVKVKSGNADAFFWYAVDPITQETASSTPLFNGAQLTKEEAIGAQTCKDLASPICNIGDPSNSLPSGTDATTYPADQQILHNE